MIIDFHTHVFPEMMANKTIEALEEQAGVKAAEDGTIKGLLNGMEKAGIDISVVMPVVTRPQQFDTVNTFARQINDTYQGKVISFGGIHPDSEDYRKKLNDIKALGIAGIKIHPDYQKVMIDDIRYMRIIEYACEIGLLVLTHAGIDIGYPQEVYCPPDKMRKVLDCVQPKNMILGHYGGWMQWDEVYEYLAGEEVYLDTAFLFGVRKKTVSTPMGTKKQEEKADAEVSNYIEEESFLKILNKHGADKVLFATDAPWSDASAGIRWINRLPVEQKIKEQILGGNAEKLLKDYLKK